ncbi:MAG: hypothetical protein VX437_06095 [Actinomycetota bacterium]|jgi:hypothetical protein|nr:hypothetical protein [Actinomycetota bacterium]MEC8522546.1 hypothetical protein [Actinomycetota bacterium]MEC9225233.1 hypothetical protein [Actinomycetota bacterium]
MATSTDRTEFISELVNLLAGPVSAGMKKAGQANQRRMQMQEHVEQLVDDAKKAGDVARRMVSLLDEIEQPLREAVPQLARAAQLLGQILDEAPDDLGEQLKNTWTTVNSLLEGLGPLLMLAQGAAGMFGTPSSTSAATGSRASNPAQKVSGAKKSAATKASPAKKTASKKRAAKTTTTKKGAPAKKPTTKKAAPAKNPTAKKSSPSKK